jgi:hypothetical protein
MFTVPAMYRPCHHGYANKRNCMECCRAALAAGRGCAGFKFCGHLELKHTCVFCKGAPEPEWESVGVLHENLDNPEFDTRRVFVMSPYEPQTILAPAPVPVLPSPPPVRPSPTTKRTGVRQRLPYRMVTQSKACTKKHTRGRQDCIYACALCNPCECGATNRNWCKPCKAVRAQQLARMTAGQ